MIKLNNIPKPKGKGRLSIQEILGGTVEPAINKMRRISADDFEDLIYEWIDEYLNSKYDKIQQYGGAGDKGRDIVGFYTNGKIDIYQCKHYSSLLSPSEFWVELGKLCYYTFNKDYPIPEKYVIMTSRGVGPKLLDYINNPTRINNDLIIEWDDKCKSEITKIKDINLTGVFKTYVSNFDFSILKNKVPQELINEYKKTSYYPQRFGGGLIKYRDVIPPPAKKIEKRELNYTNLLFEAYSDEIGKSITKKSELEKISPQFSEHLEEERASFYCTESLERFSRDNFADLKVQPFTEMKDDSLALLKSKLRISSFVKSLDRLDEAKLCVAQQAFSGNPLHREIRALDKTGMCHYLANEKKLKWKK